MVKVYNPLWRIHNNLTKQCSKVKFKCIYFILEFRLYLNMRNKIHAEWLLIHSFKWEIEIKNLVKLPVFRPYLCIYNTNSNLN